MDCQMPGIDGYPASRAIRNMETMDGTEAVPIIALTATAFQGD
ncbi:hypothetical protein YTPLAS18_07790 [Nitrospira sp.]|nr:hypothetical protein YTPLAS18_07790 [Nitrospira sp.]